MQADILRPVVVLVGWTLVMWAWMLAVRLPALKAAGIDLRTLTGTKTGDADRVLPARGEWPTHNYNHLMEQPTLFYAVAAVIALTGTATAGAIALAWGYVALRIVHSLVQATVNKVAVRLYLFVASTLCLVALTLHAARTVF
jgi:hypothetical protein